MHAHRGTVERGGGPGIHAGWQRWGVLGTPRLGMVALPESQGLILRLMFTIACLHLVRRRSRSAAVG